MSRQSVTLTEPNNEWLNAMVESKEYANKSEVINDLIRMYRRKSEQLNWLQNELDKPLANEKGTLSKEAIKAIAKGNG